MSLKKFWLAIVIILISISLIFLGYMAGYRDFINQKPDQIEVTGPNSAEVNSFINMQIRPIYGINGQPYGKMYFKIVDQRTEVLIKLENIPNKISTEDPTKQKTIPNQLNIKTARLNKEATNYIYEELGTITLNEPIDGLRSGEFPIILDSPILEINEPIQRIVIEPNSESENEDFYFSYTERSGVPPEVIGTRAPLFFIRI